MDNLTNTRKKKFISQSELAEAAEVSVMTLSFIETGKTTPNNETRRKIELCLGCRVDWLATIGFRQSQGEGEAWEQVEQDYRKSLQNIFSLPKQEQAEFIQVAIKYLTNIRLKIIETRINNETKI